MMCRRDRIVSSAPEKSRVLNKPRAPRKRQRLPLAASPHALYYLAQSVVQWPI